MTRLAFTGDRNRPGKKDWSGAFAPEALRFAGHARDVARIPLDATASDMRMLISASIRSAGPSIVGFFCHGLTRRIELGFDMGTVDELAAALAEVGCSRVALYACSTGSGKGPGGDGGFADALRDAMCRAGLVDARVLAHETAGHATQNPRKRFFDGMGSPVGGVGGYWIVEPGSSLWKPWTRRLREDADFRLTLVEMCVGEIHREL
ncbi:hypothetical protein [Sandaracinus amylolyticus]|uniref:hypothetical protein n=1 Tax=Sandaracinus amylolyticus TaxID=927083 RepID=UPI001F479B45|nr:hypothetical protein [Sandaracinus amylolyticus]UJR81505.1 Hypothetical protein I5071_35650 [Sandaracinus amylolyticus]